LPIQHSDREERPRPDTPYRCYICRLELIFDLRAERLVVRATRADEANEKERETAAISFGEMWHGVFATAAGAQPPCRDASIQLSVKYTATRHGERAEDRRPAQGHPQ
jgi:hypothetical protein